MYNVIGDIGEHDTQYIMNSFKVIPKISVLVVTHKNLAKRKQKYYLWDISTKENLKHLFQYMTERKSMQRYS